ncbi:galectin-2-like isoform X2 [Protopterus annectens]|nr:galectin-2-like isoform X2 [Protopterus annectens]
MKTGTTLKIKGKVDSDAARFNVNLGNNSNDLALHFNPRFDDSRDGYVIVCNSKSGGSWQSEQREKQLPFSQGSTVKFSIEFKDDKFVIKMPEGVEMEFPNRHNYNHIDYMAVNGGFKVTSFKLD